MRKIQSNLIDSLDFSSITDISTIPASKKVINIPNCPSVNSVLDFLTSNAANLPTNLLVFIFNIQEPKNLTFERQKLQNLSEILKSPESERIFVFQSKFRPTKFLCKSKNQALLTKIELNRNLHEDEFTNFLITNEMIFKAVVLSRVEDGICGVYDYSFSDIILDINRHFLSLKLVDYALINFDSLSLKFLQLFGIDLSLINEHGDRPLETAAKCGNFCGFLELLGSNCDFLTLLHQPTGFNLLMLAAENGSLEILQFLLERNIFDVNYCVNGQTALKLAINEKKVKAMAILLEHDARYDEEMANDFTKDVKELHRLVRNGGVGYENQEQIKKILRKYPKTRNFFDSNGQSVMITAVKVANKEASEEECSNGSEEVKQTWPSFIEFLLICGLRMGISEEFPEILTSKMTENTLFCDYIHKILSRCVIKCVNGHLSQQIDSHLKSTEKSNGSMDMTSSNPDGDKAKMSVDEELVKMVRPAANSDSLNQVESAGQAYRTGLEMIDLISLESEVNSTKDDKDSDVNSIDGSDFELVDNSDTESLVCKLNQAKIETPASNPPEASTAMDANLLNTKENGHKMMIDALKLLNDIPEAKILLEIFSLFENAKIILNLSSLSIDIKEYIPKNPKLQLESSNSVHESDTSSTYSSSSSYNDSSSEVSSLRHAMKSFDIISSASSTSYDAIDDDAQSVRSEASDRTLNSFASFDRLSVVSENVDNSSDFEEVEEQPAYEGLSQNLAGFGTNVDSFRENSTNFDTDSESFGSISSNFRKNLEIFDSDSNLSGNSENFIKISKNFDQISVKSSASSMNSTKLASKLVNLSLSPEYLVTENFAQNFIEEIFNFVVFKIFDNNLKPFHKNDKESEKNLNILAQEIHKKFLLGEIEENLIRNVFKNQNCLVWGRNLLACVPKMCVVYAKNNEKLYKVHQSLPKLFNFYKNLMIDLEKFKNSLKILVKVTKINKISGTIDKVSELSDKFEWNCQEKYRNLKIFGINSLKINENSPKSLQILFTNSSMLTAIQIFQEKSDQFLIFVDFETFLSKNFQKKNQSLLGQAYLVVQVPKNYKSDQKFKNFEVMLDLLDRILFLVESDQLEVINKENVLENVEKFFKISENFEVRFENEVLLPSDRFKMAVDSEDLEEYKEVSTNFEVNVPDFEVIPQNIEVKSPNFEVTSPFIKHKSSKNEEFPNKSEVMSPTSQSNLKIQLNITKLSHNVLDFSNNTKNHISQKKVNFQGNIFKLSILIAYEQLSDIDDESLQNIIDDTKTLKIGQIFINTEKFYYDRRFVDTYFICIVPQIKHLLKKNIGDGTSYFEEIYEKKIILLCDEPGMGKTTTLKQLQFKFKFIFPCSWVLYVDLKRHVSIYEVFKDIQLWNYENFTKFFTKVQNLNKLESIIFHKLLLEEKVVFLIDGVDEITRKHKDFMIKFTKDLYRITNCHIWIGMRPHCINEYRGAFSIFAYQLEPIDPNRFLNIFIRSKRLSYLEGIKLRDYMEEFKKFNKSSKNPLFVSIMLDVYNQLGPKFGFYTMYEKYIWKKLGIRGEESEVKTENSERKPVVWLQKSGTLNKNVRKIIACPGKLRPNDDLLAKNKASTLELTIQRNKILSKKHKNMKESLRKLKDCLKDLGPEAQSLGTAELGSHNSRVLSENKEDGSVKDPKNEKASPQKSGTSNEIIVDKSESLYKPGFSNEKYAGNSTKTSECEPMMTETSQPTDTTSNQYEGNDLIPKISKPNNSDSKTENQNSQVSSSKEWPQKLGTLDEEIYNVGAGPSGLQKHHKSTQLEPNHLQNTCYNPRHSCEMPFNLSNLKPVSSHQEPPKKILKLSSDLEIFKVSNDIDSYSQVWPQKQGIKASSEDADMLEAVDNFSTYLSNFDASSSNIDVKLMPVDDIEAPPKERSKIDTKTFKKVFKNILKVVELFQKHQKLALGKFMASLSSYGCSLALLNEQFKLTDQEVVDLSSYDIIYGTTVNQIFFIHQTFYEFLVASFLVGTVFEGPENDVQDCHNSVAFGMVFMVTEFQVIAKFIDFYAKDNENEILARKNLLFRYILRNVPLYGSLLYGRYNPGQGSNFYMNFEGLIVKKYFNLAKIALKIFENQVEVEAIFDGIALSSHEVLSDIFDADFSSEELLEVLMIFKEVFKAERKKIIFKYFVFENFTIFKNFFEKLTENGSYKFFGIIEEIFNEDELRAVFKVQIEGDLDGKSNSFLNLIHSLSKKDTNTNNLEIFLKFSNKFLELDQKTSIFQNFAENLEILPVMNQEIFRTFENFIYILKKFEIRKILKQKNFKMAKIFLNFVSKSVSSNHFQFLLRILSENLENLKILSIFENSSNLKLEFNQACAKNLKENVEIFINFLNQFLFVEIVKDFMLQKSLNSEFLAIHFLFQNYKMNFEQIFTKSEIKDLILTKDSKNETILFELIRKKQPISENFFNLMLDFLDNEELKIFLSHKNSEGKTAFQIHGNFRKNYEIIVLSPKNVQQFFTDNYKNVEILEIFKP